MIFLSLCFATPILMTEEQFFNDEKAEEITDLPQNFKDLVGQLFKYKTT
ncbi:MAG: hypothetical protein IJ180_10340 [Bacteroidales bacterium]|nr:hypothetical protein [Bacteroidales bacterium]